MCILNINHLLLMKKIFTSQKYLFCTKNLNNKIIEVYGEDIEGYPRGILDLINERKDMNAFSMFSAVKSINFSLNLIFIKDFKNLVDIVENEMELFQRRNRMINLIISAIITILIIIFLRVFSVNLIKKINKIEKNLKSVLN